MEDIQSKKKLIIQIKKKWLGDKDSGNQETIKSLQEAVTKTTTLLSTELYAVDFHFIMELIQNADDNDYKKGNVPTLEIRLQEKELIFSCNEKGFTPKDLKAICNVNTSGKISDEGERRGYIGEKGIGFKSVFKVSDMPEIYSNGFQFRLFGEKTNQHDLKYVVPEWIDNPTIDIDTDKTTLVLPLKKIYQKDGNKENDLSKELSLIEPNILLFLRKIEKLIIIDDVNDLTTEILKKVDGDIVTLTIKQKDKSKALNQKYLLISHKNRLVPEGLKEDKRAGIKYSDITLGFPLTPSKRPKILDSNKVYTFLPVKDYGLSFLINADFLLTSAREDIIDNEWNEWLRTEIFEAFKIAIEQFKNDNNFKYYFLKYLSDPDNISNKFFKQLSTDIFNYCKEIAVFPTTIRNKWASANDIIKYNLKDVQFIDKDTLQQEIEYYFMSKEAHNNYKDRVYNLFKIEPIKVIKIAQCLNNSSWVEKYNHKKLVEFYSYLQDKFRRNYDLLSDKKIIKLKSGDYKAAINNTIFLEIPQKRNKRYSFENRLDIIHTDFTSKGSNLRYFFTNIGAKKSNAETIILDYILPQFDQKLVDSTIISFTKYIKEHIDKFNSQELSKIKSSLKVITALGEVGSIKPYETFFSNGYEPRYDMEFFLKGLDGNIFLSDKYLGNEKPTEEWVTFFKELGICEYPTPHYKKKGNSDIVSCWQIERILEREDSKRYSLLIEILDANWDIYSDFTLDIVYTNYRRSRIDERLYSDWLSEFKTKGIFEINDLFYISSDVYFLSPKIVELFEDKLPILKSEDYSSESFLETIGVNFTVESGKYIALLQEYKKNEDIEISDIKEIYKELDKNMKVESNESEKTKLQELFEKEILIYKNDKWYKPSEVIWKTPPNVFKGNYTSIGGTYKSKALKSFFLKQLCVKEEIRIDDSYNFLLEFEGEKVTNDTRDIIEKLYATIELNNFNEDEINDKIDELKNSKIWLNQLNKLCEATEVFFVENPTLYNLFKQADINLFKVSDRNKTEVARIKHFFKSLGIYKPLKTALTLTIENSEEQIFNELWTEELQKAVFFSIDYIKSKEAPSIFEELTTNRKFKQLYDAKVVVLEELNANYTIRDISKSTTVESLYDSIENILYFKKSDKEIIQLLLADEVGRFLNIDGLDDFVDRVLSTKSEHRIYLKKNIQQVKGEELNQVLSGTIQRVSFDAIKDSLEIEKEEIEETNTKLNELLNTSNTNEANPSEVKIPSPSTQSKPQPEITREKIIHINEAEPNDMDDNSKEQEFDIPPFAISIETKDYDKKNDAYSKAIRPTFKDAKRSTSSYSNYRKHKPKTTGDWGELAVFLSLVKKLKEKYNPLSKYEESENLFIIKDTKDKVVVRLELLNQNGNEAASRDMELTEKDRKVLIEVKSTTDDYLSNFKVSNSQWRAMKKEEDNYWIYRVFGVGKPNCRIEKIENPYQQIIDGTIRITSNLDLGL
jgi:hypothetical protein